MMSVGLVFCLETPAAPLQYWAIEARYVREVLQCPVIYAIPQVPPFIQGVLWHRGAIYTVVDLATLLLQNAVREPSTVSYTLIMEGVGMPLALQVGNRVASVAFDQMETVEVPETAASSWVERVFRWKAERVVFCLHVPFLIQRLDQSMQAYSRKFFQSTGKGVL